MLEAFVRRAVSITDGMGTITSAWWESQGVGKKGRRYNGIVGKPPQNLPPLERSATLSCMSPFALPKPLKYILRAGLNAVDLDLNACHFQMQLRRWKSDQVPATAEFYKHRDARMQELMDSDWGEGKTACAAKQLLTSLIYGGKAPAGVPQWVVTLDAEQKLIMQKDADNNPILFQKCQERPNAMASLQYFLNEEEERKVLDQITNAGAVLKLRPWSFEHDGIVGPAQWRQVQVDGVDLKEKPMPHTWAELRAYLVYYTDLDAWPVQLELATPADIETVRQII